MNKLWLLLFIFLTCVGICAQDNLESIEAAWELNPEENEIYYLAPEGYVFETFFFGGDMIHQAEESSRPLVLAEKTELSNLVRIYLDEATKEAKGKGKIELFFRKTNPELRAPLLLSRPPIFFKDMNMWVGTDFGKVVRKKLDSRFKYYGLKVVTQELRPEFPGSMIRVNYLYLPESHELEARVVALTHIGYRWRAKLVLKVKYIR